MKKLGIFASTIAASLVAGLLAPVGCVGPNPDYISPGQIVDGAPPTTNPDAGTEPGVDGGGATTDLATPCPKPLDAAIGTTIGFDFVKCALVAGPKDGSSATAPSPDLVWYSKGTNTQLVYQPADSGVMPLWTMRDGMGNPVSGYPRSQTTNTWVTVPGTAATVYSPLAGNGGTSAGFCSFLVKGGVVGQKCATVQTFVLWTP